MKRTALLPMAAAAIIAFAALFLFPLQPLAAQEKTQSSAGQSTGAPAGSASAGTAPAAASAQPQTGAASSSGDSFLPDDSAPLLGMNLAEAFMRCGAPASVGAVRGEEAWQDDVVFSYSAGFALYWFGSRLWQIHFEKAYEGSVYGLFIGDKSDKLLSTLGTPYFQNEGGLVYRRPFKSYPVRLRVVLNKDGRISDFYLYRADF